MTAPCHSRAAALGNAAERQFGAVEPAGSISNASRAEFAVNTTFLNWAVVCEPGDGVFRSCPTARQSDADPLAQMILYGSVVTISDPSRPGLKVSGPLLGDGWRKPGDQLTFDATDSAGIRAVRLDVAGLTRRNGSVCDYRLPAPCSTRRVAGSAYPRRDAGRIARRPHRRHGHVRERDGDRSDDQRRRQRAARVARTRSPPHDRALGER